MSPTAAPDFLPALPEIALACGAMVLLLVGVFRGERSARLVSWLSVLVLIGILVLAARLGLDRRIGFYGMFVTDAFALFMKTLVLIGSAVAIVMAMRFNEEHQIARFEFPVLILLATTGMMVMVSANDLITLYLGLELQSLALYVVASFDRDSVRSSEAGLKYFVLGALSSGMLLYGASMVYGFAGTTSFTALAKMLTGESAASPGLIIGMVFISVGLAFKVSAVPFHMWVPDVYEGAPTPVTAVLASGPKAATFALMLRIFYTGFGAAGHLWFWAIWISAVLSMCIGNFAAVTQTNVKRMLAYSSIAHAGYILVAFAASTEVGIAAVLFYLAAYALMKLGAFLVVAHVGGPGERRLEIRDFAGLGTKQPALAACFSLFLLSLLGLPATGGFLGKFYAFQAALDAHIVWLVVIAAINSIVGSYYYLRVIVAMYFWEPQKEFQPIPVTPAIATALVLAAAGIIYLGIFPSRVMHYALLSALSLR